MPLKISLVVISALVVFILVAGVSTFLYQQSNANSNLNNTLFPFSGVVNPGDTSVFLKNAAGNPQIDCSSVGGKINIVGAWAEVIDPYGTCTGSSANVLNLSCGIKSAKVPCKQDADCGSGMSCAAGMCTPASCPLTNNDGSFDSTKCSCGGSYCPVRPGKTCTGPNDTSSCNDPSGAVMTCLPGTSSTGYTCQVNAGQNCMAPDPFTGQYCATYPLCSNASPVTQNGKITGMSNNICEPNSTCRPRDASAYLAGKCDGQNTCSLLFDPTNPLSGFGPSPCDITPAAQGGLPITPGQGGGYSQGYYVHGLYTCIVPQ